jgi:hypothetical protein
MIVKALVLVSKKIDHISIKNVSWLLTFVVKPIRLSHCQNQWKSMGRSTPCGKIDLLLTVETGNNLYFLINGFNYIWLVCLLVDLFLLLPLGA